MKITRTNRVPDHLVGTRQGLFHVLDGTPLLPQDDPMARADLPCASQTSEVSPRSNAMLNLPVFVKSERDRVKAFLNRDEFCFNG